MQERSKKGSKDLKKNTTKYKVPFWKQEHIPSVGETRIKNYLNAHEIFHLTEARFSDLTNDKTGQVLSFDFYIPPNPRKLDQWWGAIEYNSEIHYEYIKKFHGPKRNNTLEKQIYKDELKRLYCLKKKWNFLVIKWSDWKDMEKVLDKTFKDYKQTKVK